MVNTPMRIGMADSGLDATETSAMKTQGSAVDKIFAREPVLCDGAMGTMLHAGGISIHRCCDELNLSQPKTLAAVHAEYLLAGAEIIQTNTFGANVFRLRRHGLHDRVREINLAGVRIARQCIAQMPESQTVAACIAGTLGPLGTPFAALDTAGLKHARAAFAEQIGALAEGGPGIGADLLIIETMTSLAEAAEAIHAARDAAPGLRLVVMMTVDALGNCLDGTSPQVAAARLAALSVDAIGCNCSYGPASVLRALERMRAATSLPLAAMPNAGLPRTVEGRSVYSVSPENMARFACEYVRAGASLIGGCCGTTPSHTHAMKSALRAMAGQESKSKATVRKAGRHQSA
jgi:methionine synthase / methylenetetrahydrofolate reductase(NADPH)